jgi:multidrug resistance efflux pump
MSHEDYRPELDEMDDPVFEEALRARRRRLLLVLGVVVAAASTVVALPWGESVDASGRVAPHRWARVRSQIPGVVHEVRRRSGDVVQEGEIIAVLDSDAQRDALEGTRLSLTRERQKLADLELRLQENRILREGADAAVHEAERQALAGTRVDDSRLAALDPAASAVLEGVRGFTIEARGLLAMDRRTREATPSRGDALRRAAEAAMSGYVDRAEAAAGQVGEVAGADAGRELRDGLESVRFSFSLAEGSMQEILLKRELVTQDLLAPVALRELVNQLERETMDLARSFRALASAARGLAGSPAERRERVRAAKESRQLLANEGERLEAERRAVESGIAQAELAVRAAERQQDKTAIRAPISGTLSGGGLAEFDGVGANAPVGVVEDAGHLVLKVEVPEAEWRRVEEGQQVTAAVRGRTLRGEVAWKVPLAGQQVRDQDWNVLIDLEGDADGVEPGAKATATVAVGRRSLLRRLLGGGAGSVFEPRVAFVDDPTELRAPGTPRELAATESAPVAATVSAEDPAGGAKKADGS